MDSQSTLQSNPRSTPQSTSRFLIPRWVWVAIAVFIGVICIVWGVAYIPPATAQSGIAPTYRVFATREGLVGHQTANGHIIQPRDHFVALPSWKVLSPNGSHTYQVRLTYKGRTTVVPVWDVGPWNTNDNYWSPSRVNYSDLPVGKPMAQAAYYDGYNYGLDEFGRKIGQPNGIDIADGAFWDALGMTHNDWVDVTFLWLGRDPGPGNAIPAQPVSPNPPPRNRPPSAPQEPQPTAITRRLLVPDARPTPYVPKPSVSNPTVEEGAVVVDNEDAGYSASRGSWYMGTCGLNGSHSWTYSTNEVKKSDSRASWMVRLPTLGMYEVKAYIAPCGPKPATRSATYYVTHDDGVSRRVISQEEEAGTWVSLGIYRFGGRVNPMVELNDITSDTGRSVRFDAVMWRRVPTHTP